ncbi:MAG: tRNA preQ1(34) S-adenosylmethionine ribosyltransferase-isomerase QueA [Rickettsiales bacterium]|nr:tRNA preQ1(34) S-adenosylmethionine ribosyltransferase-isomerase QueA [Rickettsiales bacterium]
MKTDLFDFHLPESLVATHPVTPRDSAKMLCVTPAIRDASVKDLPQFLRPGDVLVLNDTRVIPARLFGRRKEAQIEILLHKKLGGLSWQVFAKPAKKLKAGDRIDFAEDFVAEVKDKNADGQVIILFAGDEAAFFEKLARYGHMPLPPYIAREDSHADTQDYQTIYARHAGAVAAPTAGLHFTPELMQAVEAAGVQCVYVTLHVGGGTFLPVKADDTDQHVMHSEWAHISAETAALINNAKQQGGRIIAVGTTSLRVLESAADEQGILQPYSAETDIFITPGYRFKIVDRLMTNFHLPKSTLFMLVSAFAGLAEMQAAYAHAIASGYRFYSYGDACLLYRK